MAKRGRRRYFKAAEKVAILKRHLVGKEEVSGICEDLKIHPNQFYEWQKLFFENGVPSRGVFYQTVRGTEAMVRAHSHLATDSFHRREQLGRNVCLRLTLQATFHRNDLCLSQSIKL